MQQFQSIKRLLIFYTLTLAIMLLVYYVMLFLALTDSSQQYSKKVFDNLQYDVIELVAPTDNEIKKILTKPFFQDISYQLILMLPSGQTYVHRRTRESESKFATVTFPKFQTDNLEATSANKLTNHSLTGMFKLKSGEQIYIVLRHQPIVVDLTSYRYWLPLITVIILFIIALLYILKRQENWEQLLLYTDNLTTTAKDSYTPPPFVEEKSTLDFLRLGHALGRISYELNYKQRRIKTLSHRLERLVDRSPLPMVMLMRQGQISFFNQRFEELFTTSFQRDSTYTLTDFVTGSDKTTQQHLIKLASQRITSTLLVYGIEDKQAYQLHITPWFGEHGQVHGFTVLLSNVSQLVSQNDNLQLKNQQQLRQLNEFGKLRAVIGHELRTPLNAIIGTLDLFDTQSLATEQQVLLTMLTESSYSMLTMLNDMLDMAKIEAGKAHIMSESVDIFKIGQHVNDLMVGNTRRQGLELLYFFAPDCPRYINTDSKRLRQILLNLLDNAIKFTSSGYVALIIEPIATKDIPQMQGYSSSAESTINDAQAEISANKLILASQTLHNKEFATDATAHTGINSQQQHYWIRFSVKDTGIGIAATEQQHLFSYFNQANSEISQGFGGTGLGLAISNSFAQLLGGFIQLDSEPGHGSTFNLYLPCRKANYQPVYHSHSSLTHIHLIAIVNQPLRAKYLQRFCDYLSLPASIYGHLDSTTIAQISTQLKQGIPQHKAVLLLDYEYYLEEMAALSETPIVSDDIIDSMTNPKQDFENTLRRSRLPKILYSMKTERSIPSTLLDQFDGFLTKPLDISLLLSELIRLTQPSSKQNALKEKTLPINDKKPSFETIERVKDIDNTDSINVNNAMNSDDNILAPLILVVEDNITNQKIICKLLSKLGYRSIIAENGLQALEKLKEQRQDFVLILMDCRMPIMDGLQATQAIRDKGDNIPIIALTANDTEEDREACIAAGMNEFLAKPIDKDKLKTILQQFIDS